MAVPTLIAGFCFPALVRTTPVSNSFVWVYANGSGPNGKIVLPGSV
jgi:hypothetical protein